VVALDPAAGNYDFTLLRQVDGAVGSFNTREGSWNFQGGNTNYVYYEDLSGQGLPDVLLGAIHVNFQPRLLLYG